MLVYEATPARIHFVDLLSWETANFEQTLARLISKKTRGKRVLILNDMVEQHYRKERVPHAGPLYRFVLLRRRLAEVFRPHPIRAALRLKEEGASLSEQRSLRQEERGVYGAMYLFAGVPMTGALCKVMEGVRLSLARVDGFCLLPVESAGMVRALSRKLAGKGDRQAKWSLFMGQHQSGGLRQIVVRDGELALTRMTPMADINVDPGEWSEEIIAEFKTTMGYLSRFGYEAADGLDIIVVCGSAPTDFLEETLRTEGRVHFLSSLDAADILGLRLGPQDDVCSADPVHVAWVAKKRIFSLPLGHRRLSRISLPRRAAAFAAFVMTSFLFLFAFQIFFGMQDMSTLRHNLDLAAQQKAGIALSLKEDRSRERETGYDFAFVRDASAVFERIEDARLRPLDVLRDVGEALEPQMALEEMDISKGKTVVTLSFPKTLSPAEAYEASLHFRDAVRKKFPAAQVDILRHVAGMGYRGKFSGYTDGPSSVSAGEKLTAVISIVSGGAGDE